MRFLYIASLAFFCSVVSMHADVHLNRDCLHTIQAIREHENYDKIRQEDRDLLQEIFDSVENLPATRVPDPTIVGLLNAVLKQLTRIENDIIDLPLLVQFYIQESQASLSFTIVDQTQEILSAIDNISIVFTGSVTIDNAPVLAAIVNTQASLGFTIVDQSEAVQAAVANARVSLGFTIADRVSNSQASLGFTVVDYASSILDAITNISTNIDLSPVKFTIVDSVSNSQASLGFTVVDYASSILDAITNISTNIDLSPVKFTIVDSVSNSQASLGFTVVDYASSILDAITNISTNIDLSPVKFTIVDSVSNSQASLGFTVVDYASSILDAIANISTNIDLSTVKFTIVDSVSNSQASLGFTIVDQSEIIQTQLASVNTNLSTKLDTISTQIGALDGSLVEFIVYEMMVAVQTFTTLASITDHVLMTLTAIDDLSQQIMNDFTSIVEAIDASVMSIGFTIMDQVRDSQASLGFTIVDQSEAVQAAVANARASLGFTIVDRVDNATISLGFTIVDSVSNSQASLGFTIVDAADNAVKSLGFTIIDQTESVFSKIDVATLCDPTPIRQSDVVAGALVLPSDVPSTIKNYCLSQDITATISLFGNNINLDLNDRVVTGLIDVFGGSNSVSNGTIRPPAPVSSGDAAIAGLSITSGSYNVLVKNCTVLCDDTLGAFAGRSAISSAGDDTIIRDCVVAAGSAGSGNGGHGIVVASPASKTYVENCLIESTGSGAGSNANGGDGIRLSSGSTNSMVRNNTIANTGDATGTGEAGMAIRDLSGSAAANTATSKVYSNFAFDIANTSTVYRIENEGAVATDNGVNIVIGLPGQFSNVYAPDTLP